MLASMPVRTEQQAEGPWEELIRDRSAFAGKRVRVTVLPDQPNGDAPFAQTVRQWLAEGNALTVTAPVGKPDPFTDALVEKARKQGLVI